MNKQDWRADSDMIFTQVSTGDFDDYKMAESSVCMIYVPDMSISRAGIAHALGRLERHYKAAAQEATAE